MTLALLLLPFAAPRLAAAPYPAEAPAAASAALLPEAHCLGHDAAAAMATDPAEAPAQAPGPGKSGCLSASACCPACLGVLLDMPGPRPPTHAGRVPQATPLPAADGIAVDPALRPPRLMA